MVHREGCPNESMIRGFVSGNLDEAQIAVLEDHLASCVQCGDTVRNWNASDTFVELVRSSAAKSSSAINDDADLQSLYQKLDELVDSNTPGEAAAHTDLLNRAIVVEVRFEPAMEADELGRLRNYRILKRLGAGGMGVVYQAEDTSLKRLVVLKILRPSLGEAARERFLQEARAAAAIEHECVVTIYQVDDENQLAFLAMQWLDGETLEDRLQRPPVLSTDEVVRISSQIASGLAAAHDKHLIHRDIKPANIWLEANQPRIRLLDFGLARAMDNNPQLTETGMLAGTPAYMSPEQARGEAVDERSDLFSLGTVMYRMLTGELPFACSNALAAIRSIQADQPESPKQRNASVPTFLSDTVMDLLEKDVRLRPTDAHTVAECLSRSQRPPRPISVEASVRTQAKQSGNGRGIGKMVALAMAFLGLAAAPFVYRLSTDFGEITVESFDPNIQVQVLQGGREVAVLDVETNDSITLRSGEYDLQLKNASSQVSLQSNQITLTRGATEIVKIMRKSDLQLAGNTAPRATSNPLAAHDADMRLYDGKTLADWLNVIKVERSPERLAAALQAIGTLATCEDSQTVCKACFALSKETNVSVLPALQSVDPKVLVPFLEDEARQGSPPRLLGQVLSDARMKPFSPEYMSVLPKYVPSLLHLAEKKETRSLVVHCLYRIPPRESFDPDTLQKLVAVFEDLIQRPWYPDGVLTRDQLELVHRLAELSPDSKVLVEVLGHSLKARFNYEGPNAGRHEFAILDKLGERGVPVLVRVLEASVNGENADTARNIASRMLPRLAKLAPQAALPFIRTYMSSSDLRLKKDAERLFEQIRRTDEFNSIPAYNDKTYNEWLSVLKNERSPQKLAEALSAVSALTTDENIRTTYNAIFELSRTADMNLVTSHAHFSPPRMNAHAWATAMVEETAVGNRKSLRLILKTFDQQSEDPKFITAVVQAITQHLDSNESADHTDLVLYGILHNAKNARAAEGIPLARQILEEHFPGDDEKLAPDAAILENAFGFLTLFPQEAQSALPLLRQYAKHSDSQIRGMAQTAIDSLTSQTGNDTDETQPDSNSDNDTEGDNAQE